ncbi:hypothetical protein [Paraburkholderia hospita]|uniref:hypothetical protein n=1 Tax=Paraburkholderia hospita TaxID=169430 RepID=UPI003ECE15B9
MDAIAEELDAEQWADLILPMESGKPGSSRLAATEHFLSGTASQRSTRSRSRRSGAASAPAKRKL